ncbi:hypothetical protein KQH21_14075 [Streptomyces sp. IpFD-1.1]|uniref:hypothetical protein n=1 Tax=Streptomyces TaxID=1883 RepID=UPI001A938F43|nr:MULTISPECIES: hypothetical protein [Streptomyces]MCO6749291.1 hypothetical protein [Streptomyces sp. IpFD-1.1]CAI4168309.1 hypothetical protein CCOS2040_16465 [Streptomyces albidoflavus]
MRRSAVAVLAAGLFFTGAGSAVADAWRNMPTLRSTGVKLTKGKYTMYPKFTKHGGFRFKADLVDDERGDGHNVYVQARVEGYSWRRFNGQQKKTVTIQKEVYDGAALYVSEAWIRACRDRGSLRPDNCTRTLHYKR